jgi:hypothetical protein
MADDSMGHGICASYEHFGLQLLPAVDPIPVGPGGSDDDPPAAPDPPALLDSLLGAAAVDASTAE